MIVDVPDIEVDLLFAEGGLVFDQSASADFKFKARQIITNSGGGGYEDMIGRSIGNAYKSIRGTVFIEYQLISCS